MDASQPTTPAAPSVLPAYRPLVLLVCTGNTCRSPMAEYMLRNLAEQAGDRLRVASAGTWPNVGQSAASEAIGLLREDGIDLCPHRSHMLTQQDVDSADLILVMERGHREDISQRFARTRDKLYLLSEMAGQYSDIDDPHGGTLEDYAICKREIADILRKGYGRIVQLASGKEQMGRKRRR